MNTNPSSQSQVKDADSITWWFKYLIKGIGTIGGLIAMVSGIFVCLTTSAMCLLAGILQILSGFLLVLMEAPCCCQFVEFADKIGTFSENRPHWQKALLYCLLGLFPIIACFSASTVFGGGLIFVTGTLHGLVVIGKKGDRDQMRAAAIGDTEMKAHLIENEETPNLHVPESIQTMK